MTSPGDRPAAELLAEYDTRRECRLCVARVGGVCYTPGCRNWMQDTVHDASVAAAAIEALAVRLARAEQALADIEALVNKWHERKVERSDYPISDYGRVATLAAYTCEKELRAALRASQGGHGD